jgi:hypothetical protein
MAKLEFAILQYLEGEKRIVLQRNDKELLVRLQIRIKENLNDKETHAIQRIEKAVDKAFTDIIKEFKDETIRIV